MRKGTAAGIACAILALGAAAQADIIIDNFTLTGDQEIPPNSSDAVGAGRIVYDTDTNRFDLDITVFGIELSELMGAGPNNSPVHLHAQPPGTAPGTANGPIVVDLGFIASFVQDGLGITIQIRDALLGGPQGGIDTDPDENEIALLEGRLYANVHTMNFPGGEVRGQIIPSPASLSLIGLAGLAAARRRR